VVAVVTLEQVRADAVAELYPRHLLPGCRDALVLFAAAFHGQQDAVWFAEAGLNATCVDTDAERLAEMADVYPAGWDFVEADAFEFATMATRQWDVVSVDCPTNLFGRCAEMLPVWCLIARRAVVLGCASKPVTPDGWRVSEMLYRSSFAGGVKWAVVVPV
jgi:hypothetical protein